jgi:hypothetical protein
MDPSQQLKSYVSDWIASNSLEEYGPNVNASCTVDETANLENYLYKATQKNVMTKPISKSVTEYSSQSTTSFTNLAEYAKNLQLYDHNYIQNSRTNSKQQSSATIKDVSSTQLSTLNNSFVNVFESLNQLIACSTLSNTTCLSSTSTRITYNNLLIEINAQNNDIKALFSKYQGTFNTFVKTSSKAMTQAQLLLQSIYAFVSYIMNIYGIVGSPSDLCGKAQPDWCQFSLEQFLIDIPTLPNLFQLTSLPPADKLSEDTSKLITSVFENISIASKKVLDNGQNMLDVLNKTLVTNIIEPIYDPPNYRQINNNGLDIDQEIINQQNNSLVSIDISFPHHYYFLNFSLC